MSRKSQYTAEEKGAELSEMLDALDALIDRTKVMYEQYFMGIQKIPPAQLHRDIERKLREVTQQQIRNTGLRFRLATLSQKFGSYNTYWRRTMREIESGRYVRDIARAQRNAQRRGEELPEEIVAAMPKRMRDRIRRDREQLRNRAEREGRVEPDTRDAHDADEAVIRSGLPRDDAGGLPQASNVHQLDDFDMLDDRLDELFQELTTSAERALDAHYAKQDAPGRQAPARPAAAAAPAPAQPASPRAATPAPRREPLPRQPLIDTSRPSVRPAPARPAAASSAVPPPPGMTEAETRDLYNSYVSARQRVGTRGEVTYDKLMRTLHEQAPRIMEQYKARGVQYSVVVKEDRVVLKALPKRDTK